MEMSSSLNPSIDRTRQAERISEAEVRVFRADRHPDMCHELVDGASSRIESVRNQTADDFQS